MCIGVEVQSLQFERFITYLLAQDAQDTAVPIFFLNAISLESQRLSRVDVWQIWFPNLKSVALVLHDIDMSYKSDAGSGFLRPDAFFRRSFRIVDRKSRLESPALEKRGRFAAG